MVDIRSTVDDILTLGNAERERLSSCFKDNKPCFRECRGLTPEAADLVGYRVGLDTLAGADGEVAAAMVDLLAVVW